MQQSLFSVRSSGARLTTPDRICSMRKSLTTQNSYIGDEAYARNSSVKLINVRKMKENGLVYQSSSTSICRNSKAIGKRPSRISTRNEKIGEVNSNASNTYVNRRDSKYGALRRMSTFSAYGQEFVDKENRRLSKNYNQRQSIVTNAIFRPKDNDEELYHDSEVIEEQNLVTAKDLLDKRDDEFKGALEE